MKRAIGVGFLAGIVIALTGLGCASLDSWNPKVCTPGNIDCTCMNPKLHIACSDNWFEPLGPPGPPMPSPITAPKAGDAGEAGDAGADGDAEGCVDSAPAAGVDE